MVDSYTQHPHNHTATHPPHNHTPHSNPPVKVPVLQLWADNDAALDAAAFTNPEEWAEDIEVHELKMCSHWIPFDRPKEVNELMRAFLGGAGNK